MVCHQDPLWCVMVMVMDYNRHEITGKLVIEVITRFEFPENRYHVVRVLMLDFYLAITEQLVLHN